MLDAYSVDIAHTVAKIVELLGIGIIALGAFGTLLQFAIRLGRSGDRMDAISDFRATLGRAILLGLEFLVAADIINTVAVQPTLMNIAVLGGIVAIRTFLSFSLEVEIEGRWPWQRQGRRPRRGATN
jgi:uncharacterized membrane protein